jgi:hypothetical protein
VERFCVAAGQSEGMARIRSAQDCVVGYLQDVDSQRKDFFVVINDEYRVAGLRHRRSHGVTCPSSCR